MRVVIEGINQKEKHYGIIDGNGVWYNDKGQCPVQKGDVVELEFVVNAKGYKDITTITKIEGAPAPASGQQAPLNLLPELTVPSPAQLGRIPQPVNGMELGLALKQAQQVQTAKIISGEGYNFSWEEYQRDAESFFVANKGIKATIIQKQI